MEAGLSGPLGPPAVPTALIREGGPVVNLIQPMEVPSAEARTSRFT